LSFSRPPARQVARILPDGRAGGPYLTYVNPSPADGAFARMARTLDELTPIVTDPGALRYFPRLTGSGVAFVARAVRPGRTRARLRGWRGTSPPSG
jgi:hypothetical protein